VVRTGSGSCLVGCIGINAVEASGMLSQIRLFS